MKTKILFGVIACLIVAVGVLSFQLAEEHSRYINERTMHFKSIETLSRAIDDYDTKLNDALEFLQRHGFSVTYEEMTRELN